jgi:glycosyltransferase involved in cell wall biosynthesis
MSKIPFEWVLFVGILVAWILLGDSRPLEKEAVVPFTRGSDVVWTHIDPPQSRIRILWIIHGYIPFVNAGSEVCAHTVNKYFMSKPYKYDVWVACPGYPKLSLDGIRCFDLYDTEILFSILSTCHVVHSHSYIYRKQLFWLCRTMGIPFVEWVHTDNYVRSVEPGRWSDARIADRCWSIFNSSSLKESRSLHTNDMLEEHTYIMNPAVDYRHYAVGENQHDRVYVTLSNVNDNKGGSLLIMLARAMPDVQFQGILGGYRSQIVEQGIPNLRYVPNTDNIKEVYAKTWVLIMPSREETWGRTAVEAMSSGIPVIAASTPGLRECCKEGAIFCDRDDIHMWISTIRRMKQDRTFYNSRSVAAFARARELDPYPELMKMEAWMLEKVCPSRKRGREPTCLEKILLFR